MAPNNNEESNTNMKLTPLHDRIVVEAAQKEERTIGGIILPDSAQEKPQRGKVLAVGPGKVLDSGKRAEIGIKVGDTVLYGRYSGTEVTVGGKDYVILRAEDVLAIVTGEAKKVVHATTKPAAKSAPTKKPAAKPMAKAKPAAKKPVAKKPVAKKPATTAKKK